MAAPEGGFQIVDSRGQPLRAAAPPMRPAGAGGGMGRARAGVPAPDGSTTIGGLLSAVFPYEAAAWSTQEMGDWNPAIASPDREINQFRDRMVARSRDLVRNSGWAAGGVVRILDNVVGTHLRLQSMPDWRALKLRFGGAFDAGWANEFRQAAEALWRTFSSSPGKWNDACEMWDMGQMFRVALRHKLIDGDSLLLSYWLDERVGYGGADYATAFMLVDPDRLSNPWQMMDSRHMRGGVELSEIGAPVAYHLREAEQNDWYSTLQANTWERIPARDDDGWRRVIHDFDPDRAGQHRGVGIFTPVLAHMKMLARYYGVELQAAVIAATFGTFVKSPYDPALVAEAMGVDDPNAQDLLIYQDVRADWANQRPALLNGARIPTLAPGEDIVGVSSQHPHGNFDGFSRAMLGIFAAASGVSVEQVTQDWSHTNYSSARASLMETWKTLQRRRAEFATNTATPAYGVWLQEAMERGELPLPMGAPDYVEAPAAYQQCRWLGPARGWVDPTKEPAGAVLRMEAGTSTLLAEAAEQGADWEEIAQQRAIEQATYKDLGIPPPKWAQMQVPDNAFFKDDEESKAQTP